MNAAAPLRRPLGCLKAAFHPSKQRLPFRRPLATTTEASTAPPSSTTSPPPPPPYKYYGIYSGHRTHALRTGFAVYAPPPSAAQTHPDPLPAHTASQIALMDPTGARTRLFSRRRPDAAKPGDVLVVTTRRAAEPFAGVCLSVRRRGIDTAVLLRGQLSKVGVEAWFKVYSRNVAGIDIVWRRPKRARRARLTYMRKPKHDMGSVEKLVMAWRKDRNVMRTRAAEAGLAGAKAKGKQGKHGRRPVKAAGSAAKLAGAPAE